MKAPLVLIAAAAALLLGLGACSKSDNATPSTAATPAPVTQPTPPAAEPTTASPVNAVGASTYTKTCALCHAAGVGGAPKPGDKADWGPRIAQGEETLFKHALEGFTGAKGAMPAKGGSPSLSDEDVKAAVTHMVNLSR